MHAQKVLGLATTRLAAWHMMHMEDFHHYGRETSLLPQEPQARYTRLGTHASAHTPTESLSQLATQTDRLATHDRTRNHIPTHGRIFCNLQGCQHVSQTRKPQNWPKYSLTAVLKGDNSNPCISNQSLHFLQCFIHYKALHPSAS